MKLIILTVCVLAAAIASPVEEIDDYRSMSELVEEESDEYMKSLRFKVKSLERYLFQNSLANIPNDVVLRDDLFLTLISDLNDSIKPLNQILNENEDESK